MLLSGDAGVGKTRLLVELRDLAVEEGWRVDAGHCLDFGDSALPYLPFSEVLGRLEVELPEVVARVAAAHPTLTRLQPGRRVLVSPESAPAGDRGEGENLDRSDLFSAVHALLEEAAAAGAAAPGHRGLPLGRPVDPRPAELPLLPAVRGTGGDRGVVPLRRPAPPPPAPPPGRRVVAAQRRRADAAGHAPRRAGPAADRQPLDGADERGRAQRDRAPRGGQRVLRRGAGGCRHPAGQLGARRPRRRAAGPARPARRRRPQGGPGRERRGSQGRPRPARRGVRARRPPSSRRGSARPSR